MLQSSAIGPGLRPFAMLINKEPKGTIRGQLDMTCEPLQLDQDALPDSLCPARRIFWIHMEVSWRDVSTRTLGSD